jgi:hypothetical protein
LSDSSRAGRLTGLPAASPWRADQAPMTLRSGPKAWDMRRAQTKAPRIAPGGFGLATVWASLPDPTSDG